MTSRANVAAGRPSPQRGLTIASSNLNTLKLTGIVIKSDPRGSYKPSRMMDLIVDGEPRTASFQQRETQLTLAWEVKPAVVITTKSIISIQPYEARTLMRRRKVETVTIQGDAVFRFCSARPGTGDKHEYERICAGFRVVLTVIVQRDSKARDKTRSGPGGRNVAPGEDGQGVPFGPPTAPNPFKRSLDALVELMELIPSDWAVYETARVTKDALQTACGFMPTYDVEEDIQNLGEQACEVLVHMHLPKLSERFASQTQTLTSLLNLIWNAAMFAEDCSKPGFREELSDSESRKDILQGFDRQFARLKRDFLAGKDTYEWVMPYTRKQVAPTPAIPSIEETRSELSNTEQETDTHTVAVDEDQKLAELLTAEFTPTNLLNLCCLDTTRRTLLSNIISWFESDAEPNVLWLSGAPGTGKTTIAWSLVSELEKQQRSAGEFFFRQNQHAPYQLWTTLAYRLAKFHPAIKGEIYKTLMREGDAPEMTDIQMTFEKLIARPLKALGARLSSRGPILLVDGLEQCGEGYTDYYRALLDTLPQWLSLPRHCKLIVTSRPQGDITKLFEGKDVKRLELLTGDDADYETNNDVRIYLTHRFSEMRRQDKSIPENWPEYDALSKLTEHASGSFKWAATAVDGIQDAGGDRERHLTTILEGGTTTKFDSLDQYFEEALSMAFGGNSPDAFRATMGAIALSEKPLTIADLEKFLQDRFPSSSDVSVEDMCRKLLPIISIEGENKAVKLRHKAYKDYLTDSKRCTGSFHIDRAKAHRNTTISCLKIMQEGLKFNICGLKSSYRKNYDIEDRESLIERCIPSHLAYACQFWADHLRGVSSTEKRDTEIVNLLRNFLNFHLLYWFEVLSLLSKSNISAKSLLTAAGWLEGTDKDLSLFAADGSRFALTFGDVIAESAPHIYLSALPFSPPSSLIHKRYRDQFPRTIKVIHEDDVKWPAMRSSIPTNSNVLSISIHPDGKKVAAGVGSDAAVISLTTGETLCQLRGHGSTVRTVAYSPSAKRIATGCDDRRLRVFESENGALLFGPFELHSDWIRSLAWSPDGLRIVTGSDDRRVKVVGAETGHTIYDTTFHNDWVRSVLYTTDFFISGSDDRTVKIYDAATGAASGEAWTTGQTGYIRALAISPDNKVLAAGSDDSTIVFYDMDRRTTINQPLTGHTAAIRSLAFSKDGQLLASGSDDYSVRLWNVQTGKKICDPLYGHTSYVSSVKFSPDMKQLISGGEDYTIRSFDMDSLPIWGKFLGGTGPFRAAVSLPDGSSILACDDSGIWRWNLNDGHVENVPFEGHPEHLSQIRSASISPHGTLVATAGRDRAVMIWQADSGKTLCGPLEGHSDDIDALTFSADGKMVASASDDRKIWVWSAETGQRVCGPMEGHMGSVRGVCFSPDGKHIASGSNDNTAIIWSVESGEKVLGPLEYHGDWIYGLAYSPNGLCLATASDDRSVVIWNVASGERMSHILTGHGGFLRCVSWSQDNKKIVTSALDYDIRVFDVETGTLVCEPLSGHKNNLSSVAFRSNGDEPEIVSASLDGTIRVWGLKMKSFIKTQTIGNDHNDWIHSIAISPVNDRIASGGDDGQLVVRDITTGEFKFVIHPHSDWVRCVTYSPDGSKIATCSDDRTISIWNAEDGERFLGPFDDHTRAVLSIAFSPGGNFLVSGSEDGTVRSWDLHPLFSKLNNPLSTYRGHKSAVNAVSYARGGSLIVSGSADAEICVWEGSVSDRCILQFGGHGGPILSICAFDEKIFSSSEDRTIRVWELSTGHALISILHGHTGPINAIALSPDGRRIVSASDDASIRIFDSDSGEPRTLPLRLPDRIFTVAVSHDGALVACSGADKTVHVWRANMARRAAWPDSFMRKARGKEFCLVDEQGILADVTLSDDGWLRGSTNEIMVWIPSNYRAGLWTPRTVGILGALETMLDMKDYVHGAKWERCRAYGFAETV